MTPTIDATRIIECDHVYKSFGDYVAVEDLNFSVDNGEILALLGRTGAGKSTVMSLLMGSAKIDDGSITVCGTNPSASFDKLRGKIAVSFQTDRLLPWRTAEENVALGLIILGQPKGEAHRAAREWLARVNLAGAGGKYVHELSGGMRQRVSLARALAVDPALILLDESFSQLDHATSKELRRDFSAVVREFGKTCVFVTHRIEDALEIADRILVLSNQARIGLELTINDAQRSDDAELSRLHDKVAAAIGEND